MLFRIFFISLYYSFRNRESDFNGNVWTSNTIVEEFQIFQNAKSKLILNCKKMNELDRCYSDVLTSRVGASIL